MKRPRTLVALSLLALTGCAANRDSITDSASPAMGLAGVDPRYVPTLQAIGAAVEAHDDATARQILLQLSARVDADSGYLDPDSPTRAEERDALDAARGMLRGFDRILSGRELVSELALSLVTRPVVEGEPGEMLLLLRAESSGRQPVSLEPGPALLTEQLLALTPMGLEVRDASSHGVGRLERIWIDPTAPTEIPLERFTPALPAGTLAGRTRFELELRSGEVVVEKERLPAMGLRVAADERRYLAGFLPTQAVEPEELAAYLARTALVDADPEAVVPQLLERAVRIAAGREGEALDAVAPWVQSASADAVARAVPALRWLAPESPAGRDGLAWKHWMRRRESDPRATQSNPGERANAPFPALDLPANRRE